MNKFTNKWTEEELKILKDASLTHNEVAEITKRNYGAVKSKRLSLNIKATTEVNYWSEAEIKILVKNRNLSSAEIARKIGRTAGAVQFKRNSLNLSRLSNKFDAFEIDFIISNYGIKSVKEISNFLGRSITSINSKASALGIAKKQDYWTQEEILFLQNNFSKKNSFIEKNINKTEKQIAYKKAHLKSIEIRDKKDKAKEGIDKDVPFSIKGKLNQYIDILSVMKVGDSFEFPTKEYTTFLAAKNHIKKKFFRTKKIDDKTRRVWRLA